MAAKKKSSSVAFTGDGLLMGMVITDMSRRFPEVTLYDRTARTNAFRRTEADLGARGLLRPQDRPWARRVARNLAAPPAVDVTADFRASRKDGMERIRLLGGRSSRDFTFSIKKAKSITELDRMARRVSTAIASMV